MRPLDRSIDKSFACPGFESCIQKQFLCFFSVFLGKYRNSNSNETSTASFRILAHYYLLIKLSFVGQYIGLLSKLMTT